MGEELCCSRNQQEINDSKNSIIPKTNIITQPINTKNDIVNNNNNINNLESNENYIKYFRDINYKDYKIEKSQHMYIKPIIKQSNYMKNFNNNNYINRRYDKNDINKFSVEIKPKLKNNVKKINNENLYEENNNINNKENNLNNDNINHEIKVTYHQNNNNEINQFKKSKIENNFDINNNNINNNNQINFNDQNINEDELYESRENFSDNDNENNQQEEEKNDINNNIEELIKDNNRKIIESIKLENSSYNNNILKNENINQNHNNLQLNKNIFKEQIQKEINEYPIINNNNIQTNNIEDINKVKLLFDSAKSSQNGSNIIKPSDIKNNITAHFNLNQNPTFGPINNNFNINNTNLVNNNNNNISQNNYSKIFENIDTKLTNNPSELKKVFDMIDNNQYNSQDQVLSDEEIDDIIKEAEKNNYKNTIQYPITKNQTIDYGQYSRTNINKIPNQIKYPLTNRMNQNVLFTPVRKKEPNPYLYPLTPDYQIKKNKNNNKYYQIIPKKPNQILAPKKTINPQRKLVYYNQYNSKTPVKTKNPQNHYLLTPPQIKPKEIIIQSPTKVNPPIIETKQKYFIASPITLPASSNQAPKVYKNIITQVPPNLYKHKTILNYPNNNIINNNNINPIKNSSKNSILNHSYLNKIQKMNQNNALITPPKYNIITNLSSSSNNKNNYLNLSFSSGHSNITSTPKKTDKYGNPIYITSPNITPKKLKDYQNNQINKRFSIKSISNLSNDDISAPLQKRRNLFENNDNYLKNSISSYESPISTPRSFKRINNDLGKSNTKVSIYEEKDKDKDTNMSIIETTEPPTGLKLEEHTNELINKYLLIDMTNPSNFNKGSYNLFYFSSPEYFRIPQNEIFGKRKIVYYLNNNPSKQAFYDGEINKLNQRHGIGKMEDPNSIKIGTWRNGAFSGWGRVIKKNGQVFEGKFTNNIITGKGIYKYKDVLYIGDFSNGIRQGKGVLFTEKFKFNGQFLGGKIDGYGKIVFLDPKCEICEYEGFFKENKIEGNGTMKWRNGNIYQGELKNGKMNGRGRFIPKDGIPSEGIFKDNIKINA